MANLKLCGVDKIYPSGTLALYDINLETRDKEFIVVLGGEASGKSTLLRIIAGLEEASSGTVFIGGKDMTDVEPMNRNVAMVSRSNTLYPSLNVFENMAFGLRKRHASQTLVEQRVKSVAEILKLTDVLYRKPKALTSAQRQRVAIGRAVAREPGLYLFDEPLAGLDDKLKDEILNVIINMQARMEGTFVYCTKNVAEAMTIGTRIVVLKNGIVQQVDTPSNLYDYPANAYVAFFIGSPTINFINKAQIVREGSDVFAQEGEVRLPLPENIVSRFKNIDEYANTGKRVIVGIRPEDAQACGGTVAAAVTRAEGEFAECLADGHTLVVKANRAVNKGDSVKIDVDCSRLYLFDAETRLTLLDRDSGYVKTDFPEADVKPLEFKEEENIKDKFKKKDEKKKKIR